MTTKYGIPCIKLPGAHGDPTLFATAMRAYKNGKNGK